VNQAFIRRSTIVQWLRDTPNLRTAEVAALAGKDVKYAFERLRLAEKGGYVVRGTPVRIKGREFPTWRAAEPQPERKRRSDIGVARKGRESRAEKISKASEPYPEQVIVLRPAPPRDVVVVGQALAQLPPLEAAWMGRRQ
jgi:hypothetical protein